MTRNPAWMRHGPNPACHLKEARMPLVDIQLIKGVFSADQKKAMIEKVTDAMVSVEGESLRSVTWVRLQEIESGQWAVGGNPLTADAVRTMAGIG
jgi:4-oxalocrotonate tautomerase